MTEYNSAISTEPKIIVALDYDSSLAAIALAERLNPTHCRLKVGKELFTHCGPQIVDELHKLGFEVFLDLKFHDIPNTVRHAVKAAAKLNVWMLNIHCMGGGAMIKAAKEEIESFGKNAPLLIGVTVLTSMSQAQLKQLGFNNSLHDTVQNLANMAYDEGLDGVVCSAQEVSFLRNAFASPFRLVTPGIRPSWAKSDDQHRIVTPCDALQMGSDYLVVGRPITQAADPAEALEKIIHEISGG